METDLIIIVSVLGSVAALLLLLVVILFVQVSRLRRVVKEMQATGRIRVQKLKMNNDRNHAFHNPALSPDEELAKRGFSMYSPEDRDQDVEAGRDRERERQTGGQLVDALAREIELRQQRQSAPPFLLQSIEDNKRRSRALGNPVANGRQSETNPNFIY
ncbi:uncharacterized protein LOC135076360 isoform X2 [Ostrinia nubilalis]|uniref:uncharacterized protein LOC114365495 n=1 Tax=Ostrinia furnacalis TaxID=93504 RepID=UPI00103C663E|nr:uncharacterized protein LOC114365495 [Ostrinia furnacalis]